MKLSNQKVKRCRPLLGTYVSIELQGNSTEKLLNACITEGFEAIAQIDQLMSYHRADSDLTRLNLARPHDWIEVHSSTIDVLKLANELFICSGGVFDIRCGGVLMKNRILPYLSGDNDCNMINHGETLPVQMSDSRVRKSGPWILDLGGIAKGYAVDCAVNRIKHLDSQNQLSGLVNAGGDLSVWGDVSLPIIPRIHRGKQFLPLQISEIAVATASVRHNDDRRSELTAGAHVQMPSGKIYTQEKSVMVFADTCILADALTKIVLLGDDDIISQSLSKYKARVFIFGAEGQFQKAIH